MGDPEVSESVSESLLPCVTVCDCLTRCADDVVSLQLRVLVHGFQWVNPIILVDACRHAVTWDATAAVPELPPSTPSVPGRLWRRADRLWLKLSPAFAQVLSWPSLKREVHGNDVLSSESDWTNHYHGITIFTTSQPHNLTFKETPLFKLLQELPAK